MKKSIADALARKGYESLTPVQQAVSEPDLEGRDLLVSAQTGSGKTIGFGLAIAPTILGDDNNFGKAEAPLALIIAPTRELALQVKRELGWLFEKAGASLASCVGGMDMRDERRALSRGAHIVVATPGRLRDHIMRGSIDLTKTRSVVLDEADEMLDLGFREDLEFILETTPEDRQTLLFSATVPNAIGTLAKRYQRDAKRISTVGEQVQHADIDYRAMMVAPRDGENAVINILRYYEAPNAIVFCNTRAMVSRLTSRLSNRGFSVVALSGELTQSERSNALQAMRDGRARVCVATDVAARGIDLPKLDLVVHAELPNGHETLLHRSGRTGRAGRKGVSAMVIPPASRRKAERLLKTAKLSAEWCSAPSATEVYARDEERLLAADDWQTNISDDERTSINKLLEQFSIDQIAAAYLRQYKEKHSAPEELGTVQNSVSKQREPFGPSVWFSVSEGRNQNASPRYLLPMICKAGNVTKTAIGAIRIADDLSYIEIREADVDGFLEAVGPKMKVEGSKKLVRLDSAPDFSTFKSTSSARKPARKQDPQKTKTPPIAWNDEPEPRARKAKPGDRKSGSPKTNRGGAHGHDGIKKGKSGEQKPTKTHPSDRGSDTKRGTGKSNAPKKEGNSPRNDFRKGPPPPKGKPNSKKNRARAAAAKARKAESKR